MTKFQLYEYHLKMLIPFKHYIIDTHLETLFNHIENNKYILLNKYRQVGMSTMLLAYALSDSRKNVLYLCPDVITATQLRRKLDYLPHSPGDKKRNSRYIKNIEFAYSTSIDAIHSVNPDLIIFDEVSCFETEYHHYYCAMPALAPKGKFVISTTPKNDVDDLFYNLFTNALEEKNQFKIECFSKII